MTAASLVSLGLWGMAMASGVMAGVYFAFSSFVMRSLDQLPIPQGVAAMQSINRVILSSTFMPLFIGSSLLSAALAAGSLLRWGQPEAAPMLAGGLVYVLGMFACTAAFNVPLNEALDGLDPTSAEAAAAWQDYLRRWTRFNHVRTVASLVTCGLFAWAIRSGG